MGVVHALVPVQCSSVPASRAGLHVLPTQHIAAGRQDSTLMLPALQSGCTLEKVWQQQVMGP